MERRVRSERSILITAALLALALGFGWKTSVGFGGNKYTLQRSSVADKPSRILDGYGRLMCAGRWLPTGPEGAWDFFESNRSRTATLTFKHGVLDGPVRLYWGSRAVPGAAGKRQVIGSMLNGQFAERWVRYAANGNVMNESFYQNGKLVSAHAFSPDQKELSPTESRIVALKLEAADRRLFDALLAVTKNAS
jgi:hypothetical protein